MSDYGRSLLGRAAGLGDRGLYGRDFFRSDPMLDARLSRGDGLPRRRGPGFSDSLIRGPDPLSVQTQVIVVDPERRCRDYAEMFLSKLKKTGLVCDIVILDKFISPSQVIDDATARGLLYTASITLQNEIHGSVTINILQGQPQEHRNMPYEDALKMVARNFDAHLLKLGGSKDQPAPVVPGALGKDEPEEDIDPSLSLLLINLAEGKNLRLLDLDKVIAFLNKKRAKFAAPTSNSAQPIPTTYQQQEKKTTPLQNAPNAPKPVQPPSITESISSSQAEDLQAKITQLFGNVSKQQSTVGVKPGATPSGGNVYTSAATDTKKKSVGIDFNNPTVQNALQNLMKTGPNILDSFRNTKESGSSATLHSVSYEMAGAKAQSEYSSSDEYKNRGDDSSRPAKRAKPGKHAIAGFY